LKKDDETIGADIKDADKTFQEVADNFIK